jgi:hypothetical protein
MYPDSSKEEGFFWIIKLFVLGLGILKFSRLSKLQCGKVNSGFT